MSFQMNGLSEIIDAFGDLDASLESMADEMLNAQGDIVVSAQKRTAQTMLQGPYNKGGVAGAVTKGKARKTPDGRALPITFEGTQHGNRLSEIAFVNEFGKVNQPGRPFIATANEECADEATSAAMNILDKALQSKGL